MAIVLTLIPITCILICIGVIFASPVYLPVIKNNFRHTSAERSLIIYLMGIVTFIICFSGFSYLDALVTKNLSGTFSKVDNPIVENSTQDDLLLRELWLQNIIMPSVRAECYTDDVTVCAVSQGIEASLDMDTKTEYLVLVFHGIIATMSNMMMVNYILRDTRKRKLHHFISG